MTTPLIACLCPTYKRPKLLRNSIACFVAQTYPNKALVILDDAGQHAARDCPAQRWRIVSQLDRYPNLPAKFNALAAMAPEADILVMWEDDDIYLPHHLAAIAEAAACAEEAAFFAPNRVLITHNLPRGCTREEGAAGGFHASWAYTRRLWDLLGGYEYGNRLDFDQHMGGRCREAVGIIHYDDTGIVRRFGPSYVYRWGNGVYHGSQAGGEGYASLWRSLGELPFERVERTGPLMDAATGLIYALHGWVKRCAKCGLELAESENEVCEACKESPVEKPMMKPTYSIKSSRHKSHREKTICLVMLVKDESAIIERCLASVHDVIDTWLIMDTGSTDDTTGKAQQLLSSKPGEWLSQPWRDFSTNRNKLLELSRNRADYTLWLDADETLILHTDAPWNGLTEPVYGIELQTPQGSFMPPRLLRRDAKVRFAGAIAETLVGIDQIPPLNNVSIHHHEDGVLWRDAARNKRDILHLETALLDNPTDPELTLALAERHASRGELTTALHYYRKRAELGGDEAQTWYALYQAARMLDDRGSATALVTEAYLNAYDFRPTKAEPLVRIARRCLQSGNYETAAEIAWAAVTTPFEDRAYFFEPAVYRGQRDLLYLRSTLQLGRYTSVVEYTERLTTDQEQPPEIQQEIDALRAIALQRQADGPRTGVVPNIPATVTQSEASRPIPAATPRREKPKLCVGMATYDDYDGVYFTVQAIRMFHSEIAEEMELLVIDNNPTGRCAEALKNLDAWIPNYRYVPEAEFHGTAARDFIFRETNADYVLVMDCHVLIVPGALRRLLEYFEANRDCADLLQGPLLYDDLTNLSTHFEPVWRQGMYGIWGTDPRGNDPEAPPFEIPMQGLGLFACRRDAWPGLNARFRGFGGEEGYIHEKFRRAGAKVLCLPFLRWSHRFHRPLGVPYAADWADRMRNYLIGHQELGLDPVQIETHFNELLGAEKTASIKAWVDNEMQSPLYGFDGVYYCREPGSALDQPVSHATFQGLGLSDRIITTEFVSIDSAEGCDARELGRILTHRRIIERARLRGLQSVLVVENATDLRRAVFVADQDLLKELHSREWSVFLFGARQSEMDFRADCATAYHTSIFDQILEEIPKQPELAKRWMTDEQGLFGYLKVMAEAP